jgi:hypothetical protein
VDESIRYTGYRRAGDWADRKRFRGAHVEWLAGLSTDEVCSQIIKPETSAAAWPAEQRERSYAQMDLARGKAGIGKAIVLGIREPRNYFWGARNILCTH